MEWQSSPYRVSRTDLARLAAVEYIRSFWWAVSGFIIFGILAAIFGRGVLQVVGFFALIWPFSIPARSIITTTKASRLFTGGVTLHAFADRLEFRGEAIGKNGKPYRMVIPIDALRDVVRRGEYFLIRTIRLGFVPVAMSAVTNPDHVAALEGLGYIHQVPVEA